MRFGITALRILVGGLFAGHGLQKLFGWFGGAGREATAQGFEGMGLKPGKVHATAAGLSETGGGLMLAAGALTPVAASLVTGVMAVAVDKVHRPNGPWVTEGGYEYNLVLVAAAFAITAEGPGALSVDERLGIDLSGPLVALAELALGLGGAVALTRLASDAAAQDSPTPAADGTPQGA